MFERILFPVDFSEYSRKSVECGSELKEIGAKEIVLLHVIDEKFSEPLRKYSQKGPELLQTVLESYEKEVREKLKEFEKALKDFKVKSRVEYGDPPEEILRIAKEENVSLIYMGGRGESWISPRMFGGVAEAVAMSSPLPILFTKFSVVKDAEKSYCEITFSRLFDRILYATDFSPTSEKLLSIIEKFGKLSEGVDIVVATEDMDIREGESYEEAVKGLETKAIKAKEKIEETLNVPVNLFIIPGEAGRAIIEVAERENSSLIVIGAKGKGNAKGIGRSADEVLRRAKVPVLLVR